MTTFSQLVDKMVKETLRPDLLTEIGSYLNQTLREVHMEPSKGNAVFFRDNLKEDRLTATRDQGFSWAIPQPSVFQGLQAVRYDCVYTNDKPTYSEEMSPGRGMAAKYWTHYRSGRTVFFHGYGRTNDSISLAWYEYVPNLQYYVVALRPAQYQEDPTGVTDGWTYAPSITTPEQEAIAQIQCSNWLLLRWPTVIEEGLRAKIYKRVADQARAALSYSMYTTLRQGLVSSESADINGAW